MDFAEFFDSTGPGLVRLCYLATLDRDAAADAAQETMTRAWRDWAKVGAPGSDPGAWTRTVALNLCRSRWRTIGARARKQPLGRVAEPIDDVPADLDLLRALRGLAVRQREAVVLRYWADLEIADVAAAMGVSVGSVKQHLSRARVHLAAALGEHVTDELEVETQ